MAADETHEYVLSDLTSQLSDLPSIASEEKLHSSNRLNSWETSILSHGEQIITKIRQKEEEIDILRKGIEISREALEKEFAGKKRKLDEYRETLEVQYKSLCKELRDQIAYNDVLRTKMEENYKKKIEDFENEKEKMSNIYNVQEGKIKLDIGGHLFTTSKITLTHDQDSMFAVMFSGRHENIKAEDGSYFIDRDGTYFRYILNYLRGVITIPSDLPGDSSILNELRSEADFYQLSGLAELIDEALERLSDNRDFTQEEITELMSTQMNVFISGSAIPYLSDFQLLEDELPPNRMNNAVCQNMTKSKLNFSNKRLNKLSFAHTIFFHDVLFRNACLVGASFYGCEFGVGVNISFDYADLTDCDFRQCKGKEAGFNLNVSRGGGLVSGSSSEIFFQMVQQGRITFKKAKLHSTLFDPKVHKFLHNR